MNTFAHQRIVIVGELSIYTVAEWKQRLDDLLGRGGLELDLGAVRKLDAAGLQLLIMLKKEVVRRNQQLRLINHSQAVLQAFDLCDIADFFGDPILCNRAFHEKAVTMIPDGAQQSFIVESHELLQQMEDALSHIEMNPDDQKTINAIFHVTNTIQNSAGLLSLDDIVALTNVAESVFARVREKYFHFDGAQTALFQRVRDHIGVLVSLAADSVSVQQSESLVETERDSETCNVKLPTQHWHISLCLGHDLLRNGMDPLVFIRNLVALGHICNIAILSESMPPWIEVNPETCYLGFEIGFHSDAHQTAIEGVFEFICAGSRVHILSPHCKTDEYRKAIQALPQESLRLGEIFLIRCGIHPSEELNESPRIVPRTSQPYDWGSAGLPAIEEARKKTVKGSRKTENNLIHVDTGQLDLLIKLVGELIVAVAAATLAARNAGGSELVDVMTVLACRMEEVHDSVLTLRMMQSTRSCL